MIDNPRYSEMEIMQEIREKYGTDGANSEGATTSPGTVQDGIRSGEPEGRQPGGTPGGRDQANGRRARKTRRDVGVARGSYKRKGRTDPAPTQVRRGFDSGDGSANGTIQRNQRESDRIEKEDYAKEEKPAGIDARPNAKERKIRQEQEATEQAKRTAEQDKASQPQSFFAWIRSGNNRKANGKEEKQFSIRSKPLSAKKAEEIRQPLIDAIIDYFKYTDELMSGTSANGVQAQIWSTIDDEEIGILIDAWLARARVDERMAGYAVAAVNNHYKLKIGLILAPRFYQTFRFYVDNGMRSPFPAQRRKQREKQRRPLSVVARDN